MEGLGEGNRGAVSVVDVMSKEGEGMGVGSKSREGFEQLGDVEESDNTSTSVVGN